MYYSKILYFISTITIVISSDITTSTTIIERPIVKPFGPTRANHFLSDCSTEPMTMSISDEEILMDNQQQKLVKVFLENVDLSIGRVTCFKFEDEMNLKYYKIKVSSVADACSEMKELYYSPIDVEVTYNTFYENTFLDSFLTTRCKDKSIYDHLTSNVKTHFSKKGCSIIENGFFANDLVEWSIDLKNTNPTSYYKVSSCESYKEVVKFEFSSLADNNVVKTKDVSADGDKIIVDFDNIRIKLTPTIRNPEVSVNLFESCVIQRFVNGNFVDTSLVQNCNKDHGNVIGKFGEIKCAFENLKNLDCQHLINYQAIQTFATDNCKTKNDKDVCLNFDFTDGKELFNNGKLPRDGFRFSTNFEKGELVINIRRQMLN